MTNPWNSCARFHSDASSVSLTVLLQRSQYEKTDFSFINYIVTSYLSQRKQHLDIIHVRTCCCYHCDERSCGIATHRLFLFLGSSLVCTMNWWRDMNQPLLLVRTDHESFFLLHCLPCQCRRRKFSDIRTRTSTGTNSKLWYRYDEWNLHLVRNSKREAWRSSDCGCFISTWHFLCRNVGR